MTNVYQDNNHEFGLETRVFRDTEGGVEWMYAANYAQGDRRWYFFLPGAGESVEELKRGGMILSRFDGSDS